MRRDYTLRRHTQKYLSGMETRNRIERGNSSMENIRRSLRADLQKNFPSLTDSEIEDLVTRRVRQGMKPTNSILPSRC